MCGMFVVTDLFGNDSVIEKYWLKLPRHPCSHFVSREHPCLCQGDIGEWT